MNETNKFYEAQKTLDLAFKRLLIYDYLVDPSITEINCNCDSKIFIQKVGIGAVDTNILADSSTIINIINILASLQGLIINDKNPRISTILPFLGGCRVEGLLPPVVSNPSLSIRKKSTRIITLDEYVKQGIFTEKEKNLMKEYVYKKKNILIIGGTNTGKTTFANALVREMNDERLLFIEEVRELQSDAKNKIFLQVIDGIFSPKDALKSAMRMSPERIIYGEVRGAEAFDLLNAFNSGHSGGVSTIHANDCYSGLEKLETYILYEHSNPMQKVIARTINVVLVLKFINGKRVLDSIAEVNGYLNEHYILDFKYKREEE